MSASLVGSEMCIRDRRDATTAPPIARSRPPRGACSALLTGRPGPIPVSYTHLTLPTICSV
eukprot:14969335-Alexandrium_andersonii.AAC.1